MANDEGNQKPKSSLEERAKQLVRDVIEAIEGLIPDFTPEPQYAPIPARPSRARPRRR